MAGIFLGHPFTSKDMTEVPSAMGTDDLGASAVGVGNFSDSAGQRRIETRPAAPGVKFGLRGEELGAALSAGVAPLFVMIKIHSGKGRLGSLMEDDTGFFGLE